MYWGWITKGLLLALLTLTALCLGLWLFFIARTADETRVVFLSVGQGDAILITQGTNQIVIDGGRDGRLLLSRLGRYVPFYDRTIEVLIPTHPDLDHIGGLTALLERYQVKTVLDTGARSETEAAQIFYATLQRENATIVPALRGTEVTLPRGGKLALLFPETPLLADIPETNEGSIISRFDFGETSFLFTGDLPDEERFLPTVEPADILKVAHHGSRYSTSDAWLALVQPTEAVISVGENSYGHPHPDVLGRLGERGISILRTDTLGDITYQCLGERALCLR